MQRFYIVFKNDFLFQHLHLPYNHFPITTTPQ